MRPLYKYFLCAIIEMPYEILGLVRYRSWSLIIAQKLVST